MILVIDDKNTSKVNTVPCMCTSTLGQRVDNWLHCLLYIEMITNAYRQQKEEVLMMESTLYY